MNRLIALILILISPMQASALQIFACEPEWGSLARELAGDAAQITTATTAYQDPHRLEAKPSLIAAVRRADLLICTGADLEIGWLPLLLRRSGNTAIKPGSPGNLLAADFVRRIELPDRIDRGEGDIHPQGNPHIHLNPHNVERVAKALADRLRQIDPAGSSGYQAREKEFLARWQEATATWEDRAMNLAGLRLVSHHRGFSYLADWLHLDILADIEPKPGIPATAAHLATLVEALGPNPPAGIVRTPYTDSKASLWLSEKLGVPAMQLPYTVGGSDRATDLFGLFDDTLTQLEALRR
ncbi:MAG: zinc ABC transporter substrate-binding protein [Gammaproteobacteria bacterium]|nr:zinc ABC transporter substrate-binding protein [Gammaproteobacteria bacterium]MDH4313660.1 zinc ABC transporter substrate-binding protein [Gammaproteobacteria bacterium]MDH5215405.1 zinc ABC transporter substrate-binding protein [Gammaproteobacteria bacterium]MDH5500325.1 zinc ABC transporter substrate-binding protein [Gammaproteobacteria bacterium]